MFRKEAGPDHGGYKNYPQVIFRSVKHEYASAEDPNLYGLAKTTRLPSI